MAIQKRLKMHVKQGYLLLAILTTLAAFVNVTNAAATTYDVSRSWTNGFTAASLVGTVDIPQGNYTIMSMGASPFTAVNLTMTVGGTPFSLSHVLTEMISGTGEFFIDATPTDLIFNTANADGVNPADLIFSENLLDVLPRYGIGSDSSPGFEIADSNAFSVSHPLNFPVVFGTAAVAAVPEPTTMLLLGSGFIGLAGYWRKKFFKNSGS